MTKGAVTSADRPMCCLAHVNRATGLGASGHGPSGTGWAVASSRHGHGFDDPYAHQGGFGTSRKEVLHLIAAVVLLTGIFTIWLKRNMFPGLSYEELAIISAVATGTGFLLHEIAHKIVAQYYGHWAEFRAQWWGLLLPYPIVLFTQLIFAAPGAVVISGFVTRKQNGLISAAGPATNLLIVAAGIPLTLVPGSSETLLGRMGFTLIFINGLLATFNLLPIGPLDGRKVWRWNPLVYLLLVALAVGSLVVLAMLPVGHLLT